VTTATHAHPHLGPVARLEHLAVRGYRRATDGRPSPCRYVPSCSSYALEVLEAHGAGRGSWLTLRRLLRCHPWGRGGWDPVPQGKAN
jgi:putative membrane protein insertion efficiency factor